MGAINWEQKVQIENITKKKESADKEIQRIQVQMQMETDSDKLQALEDRLQSLTGKAQAAIGEMQQKDKSKAAEMAEGGDDLERDIRRILRKFDAETYGVPPVFKQARPKQIDATARRRSTRPV